MNQFFIITLLINTILLIAPTFSMELDTQSIITNRKIEFLDNVLSEISVNKDSQPMQYFSDLQKVANAIYYTKLIRNPIFKIKNKFRHAHQVQKFVEYDGKFINGFLRSPILLKKLKGYQAQSPFGQLAGYESSYGDQEWCQIPTTDEEKQFLSELIEKSSESTELLDYLKNHLNNTNNKIAQLARVSFFYYSTEEALHQIGTLYLMRQVTKRPEALAYLAPLRLTDLFKEESFLSNLIAEAFASSGESFLSAIKELTPSCTSPIFNVLKQEDQALNNYYIKVIQELQKYQDVHAHCIAKYKQQKSLKECFSIAPELQDAFAYCGLKTLLPGIELPKKIRSNQKNKKNSGKNKTKNKNTKRKQLNTPKAQQLKQHTNSQEIVKTEKEEIVKPLTESSNNKREKATPANQKKQQPAKLIINEKPNQKSIVHEVIVYDSRVLEQNNNKDDSYHGFCLGFTVPYILKYGNHGTWPNKTTGNLDDTYTINGTIKYAHQNSAALDVTFSVTKGVDGAIYHIEMKRQDENKENIEQNIYNKEFPPLSMPTNISVTSPNDQYGSKIENETNHTVIIWDGGQKATITLYKQ